MTAVGSVIFAVTALLVVGVAWSYTEDALEELLQHDELLSNIEVHARQVREVNCDSKPKKFWKVFKCCKKMPHLEGGGCKGKGKWKGGKGGESGESGEKGGPPGGRRGPPEGRGPPDGKRGPPDGKRGPPRGRKGDFECHVEKKFEKKGWAKNGTLDAESIKSYINEKHLSKDKGSPWSSIVPEAVDTCVKSATEESSQSNSTCKSGAFQFQMCYHTELLKKCPADRLKTDEKCNEKMEYVRNCGVPKPPQGPPPPGEEGGAPPPPPGEEGGAPPPPPGEEGGAPPPPEDGEGPPVEEFDDGEGEAEAVP